VIPLRRRGLGLDLAGKRGVSEDHKGVVDRAAGTGGLARTKLSFEGLRSRRSSTSRMGRERPLSSTPRLRRFAQKPFGCFIHTSIGRGQRVGDPGGAERDAGGLARRRIRVGPNAGHALESIRRRASNQLGGGRAETRSAGGNRIGTRRLRPREVNGVSGRNSTDFGFEQECGAVISARRRFRWRRGGGLRLALGLRRDMVDL